MTIYKFEKKIPSSKNSEILKKKFALVWTWESWDPPGEGTWEKHFSNMWENHYVFDCFCLPTPIEEAHRADRKEKTSGRLQIFCYETSIKISTFLTSIVTFPSTMGPSLKWYKYGITKTFQKKETFFRNSLNHLAIISPSRQSSLRTWSRPAAHPKVTWLWSWRKWRKLRHPVSTKKKSFFFHFLCRKTCFCTYQNCYPPGALALFMAALRLRLRRWWRYFVLF